MTLRGRIKMGMVARGIASESDLARRLHMHRQTVHKWLAGEVTKLEPEYLFALADVLECNPRWLALREGEQQKPVTLDLQRTEVIQIYDELVKQKLARAWMRSGSAMLEETGATSTTQPFKPRQRTS